MLMTATKPPPITVKRQVECQALLEWAFREELPKQQLSAQEARWRGMEVSGPFGPVDEGTPIQRYAYVGTPHRDAIAIEAAVNELPMVEIDWAESMEAIMGDLAGLVSIGDVTPSPFASGRVTQSSWPAKTYSKTKLREQSINCPRDVLMVGSIQTAALVQSHARQGTSPKWHPQNPTCHATPPRGPGDAMIVGECRGKNLYSTGSHCPLTWRPSPITIAQHRADYIGWWRGLTMLAEWLDLSEHAVLPPVAPQLPWFDDQPEVWLFGQRVPFKMSKLPLKPDRPLAGPTRGQAEDVARRYPGRRIHPNLPS